MFNRPWFLMPVPVEWTREGDKTTVTRIQRYPVNVHGTYSLENLPLEFFEIMKARDEMDAEAEEAAIAAAKAGGDE